MPRLLAVSDRRSLGEPLDAWAARLRQASIDGLQVREKDLSDLELYDLVRRLRRLLPPPTCLLVNGRADVALAAGADGVHLPSSGLPAGALRRRFGPELLIGLSTHHPEEVAEARRSGADYAVFGPVYPTPSKAGYGPPPGLAGLRQAVATGLPVLALGGVTIERLGEVAEAGAAGAAGIRCFQAPHHDLARLAAEAARRFQPVESIPQLRGSRD